MSETLWDAFEAHEAELIKLWRKHNPELVLEDGTLLSSARADAALAFIESIPDYPIVQCGDSKVVLAVDREELVEAVHNDPLAQEVVSVTIEHNKRGDESRVVNVEVDYLTIIDAILAKLSFREVEGPAMRSDVESGEDVVTLKPLPTSKEE